MGPPLAVARCSPSGDFVRRIGGKQADTALSGLRPFGDQDPQDRVSGQTTGDVERDRRSERRPGERRQSSVGFLMVKHSVLWLVWSAALKFLSPE